MFETNSHCYCCRTCEKHEVNQRRGYIIPCKDKFSCSRYLENLEQDKQAHERESADARAAQYCWSSNHHRVVTPKR